MQAMSSSLPDHAMHELAGQGDVIGVARMLGAGSWPLDLRDESGCTALHFAADRGHCDVVELLVKAGAFKLYCSIVDGICKSKSIVENSTKLSISALTQVPMSILRMRTVSPLCITPPCVSMRR